MKKKQITRWIGKNSRNWYSIWSKKPEKFVDGRFLDKDGNYHYSDTRVSTVCRDNLIKIVPSLKTKVGQLFKVKIVVEQDNT